MPKRCSFTLLLTLVFVVGLQAVERPNTVTLEVLGKSTVTSDLAYERRFTSRVAAGAGFGVNGISRVDFTHDGTSYQGTDISMPLNIYGIVSMGRGRHHLIAPFGLVLFTEFSLHPYRRFFAAEPVPFVGLGYELRGERLAFRVPVYLAYLGEPSEMLPSLMPWVGLSLGYSF